MLRRCVCRVACVRCCTAAATTATAATSSPALVRRDHVTIVARRACASSSSSTTSYAHMGALHSEPVRGAAAPHDSGSDACDSHSVSNSDSGATTATAASTPPPLHEQQQQQQQQEEGGNDKAVVERHGFIAPSDDIVLETARLALAREGRDVQPEAQVWRWETTAPPILAQGKQNVYDLTDDIPAHVKPFWFYEYYQQREYFRLQRSRRPLRERVRLWLGLLAVVTASGVLLTFFRVWVEQPRQIREMRQEILQNAYGRVLELAAGHGQNIGAYPYAVHDVVLSDSNPQQLQALRYRIPHTAYPKYSVQRVRAESLDVFADGEFDCVVDMFGLCHMHDPVMALRQMQRVVKPNGVILLLEHGASPYVPVNWFLDYFQHRHTVNTHGCRWNLPIRAYLREARLEIKELRNMHYGTTYYVVAYPEVLNAMQRQQQQQQQHQHQ